MTTVVRGSLLAPQMAGPIVWRKYTTRGRLGIGGPEMIPTRVWTQVERLTSKTAAAVATKVSSVSRSPTT